LYNIDTVLLSASANTFRSDSSALHLKSSEEGQKFLPNDVLTFDNETPETDGPSQVRPEMTSGFMSSSPGPSGW